MVFPLHKSFSPFFPSIYLFLSLCHQFPYGDLLDLACAKICTDKTKYKDSQVGNDQKPIGYGDLGQYIFQKSQYQDAKDRSQKHCHDSRRHDPKSQLELQFLGCVTQTLQNTEFSVLILMVDDIRMERIIITTMAATIMNIMLMPRKVMVNEEIIS